MNFKNQVTSIVLAGLAVGAVASQDTSIAEQGERPEARRLLEQVPGLRQSPTGILVRFRSGASDNDKASVRAAVRGTRLTKFSLVPGLELIDAPMGTSRAIAALSNNPHVEYAQPDFVVRPTATPNDPMFGSMWNLNNALGPDINGPEAWDIFSGSASFVVAVIDTGTHYNHIDLAANVWTNPGEIPGNGIDDDGNGYRDDVHGWNFYDHNNDPSDQNSHGTHTAGTIGAVGNNGIGVTGINWRCKLMPLKFLGPDGGYTSDAVLAIQYAVRMGVKVSNNSWGGPDYDQAIFDAINAARTSGHLFVAAAGNAGTNNDYAPFYPAAYNLDNVIAVAASDSSDNRAGFSNYGATSVDLGAPGVDILSTTPGDGFGYSSGTSMAAPHVTGVAALLFAKNPGWTYQQVRDRIFSTVKPVASMAGVTRTGGVLDAFAALNIVAPNNPPQLTINSPTSGATVALGATVTFSGTATDQEDGNISARTVWTSSLQGQLGTGASFSRSDLVAGTHSITASVTDNGGITATKTVQLSVQQGVPVAPAMRSVVASGSTITIMWYDNSSNEAGFEVQREQRNRRNWKNTTTIGTTGPNITSIVDQAGTGVWRYRVRALSPAGSSEWSAWMAVK
jgi:subtilisin family serine protease